MKIRILDTETRESIPGVAIAALDATGVPTAKGTTTDIDGYFDGSVFAATDSIIIKHISYQDITDTAINLHDGDTIYLSPKSVTLKDFTVSELSWQTALKTIGWGALGFYTLRKIYLLFK